VNMQVLLHTHQCSAVSYNVHLCTSGKPRTCSLCPCVARQPAQSSSTSSSVMWCQLSSSDSLICQ